MIKDVTLYIVSAEGNKTYFVNTDTAEHAMEIVAEEQGVEVLGCDSYTFGANESVDIVTPFL